jgi:1-acyl-sn-glycerol-3-phosphate acyltransferase
MYCALASVGWSAAMFLPRFTMRWSVLRNCAKLFAKTTKTKILVNGLENIPADGQPYVLVSNHASYLDSYALLATLPGYAHFIAKKELTNYFFIRIPLKNIRTEFVDRYETGKSIENTQRLANTLKAGNALMFFVEGTFTRIPGLRPFLLGAFSVAAETETPVIPVAIRGTRSILRSGSWFPHHGSINIDIGEAINPKQISDESGKDFVIAAVNIFYGIVVNLTLLRKAHSK